jgi:ribonucleoside-diphosphate reductase alpha chain
MAHVRMMAATQPFLSGAISKTVNLPNDATIEDVQKIYEEGWRLGLKAVALYRDGCKASQPLSSTSETKAEKEAKAAEVRAPVSLSAEALVSLADAIQGRTEKPVEARGPLAIDGRPIPRSPIEARRQGKQDQRIRLPKRRRGFTQEARVGGHKIYLRTGEYEDGTLGEIFIDLHKEGAAFRSMMNCFAMAVSVGLQYGVPLEAFVDQYTFTRFEPQGMVEGHENIRMATSIVDYLFRALGIAYLHRYELAHVPPVDASPTQDPSESKAQEAIAATALPSPTAVPWMETPIHHAATSGSALDAQLEDMMGDAPVCDACGHITVRNGACYKCLNCGNSMGCS